MKRILEVFFPEKHICFMCEDYGKDIKQNLCSICREKLVFIKKSSCSICSRKIETHEEIDSIIKCTECIRRPHYYTRSVSPLSYEKDIKRAIYNFKYNDKQHMYKLFGKLMIESIIENDLEYLDVVVPIPLHKDRERKRGFNQAELIARYISVHLKLELDTKNLTRETHTKAQNKLDSSQRRRNISGAFNLKDKQAFLSKKVLLIDDIYTTGSTVDECSRLLLEHGADKIFVSTLAVTPSKNRDIN